MFSDLKHKKPLAYLGLVYATMIWGSTFFIIKNNLQYVNPVILVSYRFLIAAIVLGAILLIQRKSLFSNLKQGFILGFFLWLIFVPQTLGLKFTTASNSAFITGLFVLFVPLFSRMFFKKTPSLNGTIAVIVSLFGLWLLTGGIGNMNRGDTLTLITAMAGAMHILYADKYINKGVDPYIFSFQQFLCVGLLSLITSLVFRLPLGVEKTSVIGIIILLALFPTLLAFVIQLFAQKIIAPVQIAIIFTLEPVFGGISSWTLGGEKFVPMRAVGGLLIVLAMVISELPTRAKTLAVKK